MTDETLRDMAARLREALAHRRISQRDLAREIRVGEPTISAIFQGKQEPRADTLIAICGQLRVHPSYVMLGLEPKYLDSGASWTPVGELPPLSGVEAWLGAAHDVTEAEAAWLRTLPWSDPTRRYQDSVYQLLLIAYRQMQPATGPDMLASARDTRPAQK